MKWDKKKDVRGGEMIEYRKQNCQEQKKKKPADTTWVKKRHEDKRGGQKGRAEENLRQEEKRHDIRWDESREEESLI